MADGFCHWPDEFVAVRRNRPVRITIRVQPGSARPAVGGEQAGALVVRVSTPAVDGQTAEAELVAVADALGDGRDNVRLVAGHQSAPR